MNDVPVCIFEARNVCGEGPVWDAEEGALYWVDIPENMVHRLDPSTGQARRWRVPAEIGALALRRHGGIIAALRTGFALIDLDTDAVQTVADPEADEPATRFNDGKCDRRGRFWCGSLHDVPDPKRRRPVAALYRVDPDLTCHRVLEGIKTSNGIAWSPDDRTMYFTDTPTFEISAFDYDLDSGTIANRRVFARVPPGEGRPDGVTIDSEGCLWSAHFDGWRVTRYAPDGSIDRVVRLPVQNVTSCAFGGPDLDVLYITSATEDLSPEALTQQPLAGGIFALRPGVRGLPMSRFAG